MSNLATKDIFDGFSKESKRIRSLSTKYKNTSIADAFKEEYGLEISSKSEQALDVVTLELGNVYLGTVKEISKRGITFEIPGLKDQIICKENFSNSIEAVQMYLLQNDNKLYFEVREKVKDTIIVSVMNAYYRIWLEDMKNSIKNHLPIIVHIDNIIKGGYICHTSIWPLASLTQQNYTAMAFIPGSQIILNIEKDFDQWLGKDVIVIPQNFQDYVDYTAMRKGAPVKSLVCSRKKHLQMIGMKNLHEMWEAYTKDESTKDDLMSTPFNGVVTGIINSKTKTGVFVELVDECITGLMPIESFDLLNYQPGDEIKVRIKELEVQAEKQPFITKKVNNETVIIHSNVRPIFERVL